MPTISATSWGRTRRGKAFQKPRRRPTKHLNWTRRLRRPTQPWTGKSHYEFDFPGAEKEFLKAIELNPNSSTAHLFYSNCFLAPMQLQKPLLKIRRLWHWTPVVAHQQLHGRDVFWQATMRNPISSSSVRSRWIQPSRWLTLIFRSPDRHGEV